MSTVSWSVESELMILLLLWGVGGSCLNSISLNCKALKSSSKGKRVLLILAIFFVLIEGSKYLLKS